jgi:hypothetical protein
MSIAAPAKKSPRAKSVINFDASQRKFFDDPAGVIAVCFHRQKGKDFVAAAKAVNEACQTAQDWWIVGMTQAQADETFNKVKKVVEAMKAVLKRMFGTDQVRDDETEHYIDYDKEIKQRFECSSRIMRLPNGARIVSLPGRNPDALAGRTGNMILTEFGLYPKGGNDHWDILFPTVTRGGFRFIMISTPRGKNTKFYDVFSNRDGLYSTHFCDIYKSVYEEGYQLYDAQRRPFPMATREEQEYAIAMFRKAYNSESKWAREYECKFTGDLSSLITWAQLERAAQLGAGLPFDYVHVNGNGHPVGDVWAEMKAQASAGTRVEVGWDVARTADGDLSAVPVNFSRPNAPKHLRFLVTMRGMEFGDMRSFVRAAMELRWGSVGSGDATGLGRESNETLAKLFPDRWTPFMFTAPGKREIASSLSTAFSDGTQTIPSLEGDHKFIATDLYAIQKDDTGGQLQIDETTNVLLPESHCDIAYGVGLARVAGARNFQLPPPPPPGRVKPLGW